MVLQTGPHNLLGLEINTFAAELARVTVWIGDLQWCRRNGYPFSRNPILKPLTGIERRDALLNPDGSEAQWPKADVVVPEKRWSELPLVGPMFQPADASNIIDGVYKDFQKVTQAKTTYDNLIVKGETGKAQAFLQENLQLIMMNQMAGEYRQMMGELTKNERIIRGSKLTEEEKRKLVDQIKAAKIQIAASVRAVLERKEPQAAPA